MRRKRIEIFAKYAGLVTIGFEWLAFALFYVLRPSEFSGDTPISYFASFPETRLVFAICLTIAAASFWIFTAFHLPKFYTVPVRMFAASMLGYAALALTPFDPNNATSDIVHRILALFFSLTFLAGIYIMGRKNDDPKLRLASFLTVLLSGVMLALFFAVPKDSQLVLLLEVISAFVGQVWIVWISFYSFRAGRSAD